MYSLQKSSRLCQLPDELILTIRDHLDALPAAKAYLALTCHYLLDVMGKESLHALNIRHSEAREEYLTRLNVPGYYYCYWFSVLRPFSKNLVPWKDKEFQNQNAWYEAKWGLLGHPVHSGFAACTLAMWKQWPSLYCFRYVHLQLAMRRHHLGPDYGIDLDNLSLIEVVPIPTRFVHQVVLVLTSFEARICPYSDRGEQDEHLYVRVQNCVYFKDILVLRDTHRYLFRALNHICAHQQPASQNPLRYTDGDTQYDNLTAGICPVHVDDGDDLELDYVSPSDELPKGTYPSESGCFECPRCELNFQICLEPSVAVTVTKWYRLGRGESHIEDPWVRHHEPDKNENGFVLGSGAVRQAFERAPGLSQEDLMKRNIRILKSKKFWNWNWEREESDTRPEYSRTIYYHPGKYPLEKLPESG